MSIKRKLYMIIVVSMVISCGVSMLAYFFQKRALTGQQTELTDRLSERDMVNLAKELAALSDNVTLLVHNIEDTIDGQMRNAALTLQVRDTHAAVNLDDLIEITEMTGMSDMYFADLNGKFTLSTVAESIGTNLFDIGEEYRKLVTGESAEIPSNMKIMAETGAIYKFTAIPRYDRFGQITGIIEAAMDAQILQNVFQEFLDKNPMLNGLYVVQSDGVVLTSNQNEESILKYQQGSQITEPLLKKVFNSSQPEMTQGDGGAIFYYTPMRRYGENAYVIITEVNQKYFQANTEFTKENLTRLIDTFERNLFINTIGWLLITLLIAMIYIVLTEKSILEPIKQLCLGAEKIAAGNVEMQVEINTQDEIGALYRAFLSVAQNVQEQSVALSRIAQGDFSVKVQERSDEDLMSKSINGMVAAQKKYVEDISLVMKSLSEGNLSAKIETPFPGDFAPIQESINNTIDIFSNSIVEITRVLNLVSNGVLSEKIEKEFVGDYHQLKHYVNEMIAVQRGYVNDISRVMQGLQEGNLSVSTEVDYCGDFKPIQESINKATEYLKKYIEAIEHILGAISHKDLTDCISIDFKGDFNALKTSLNEILLFLNETIQQIYERSIIVLQRSESIAEGSVSLREGTTEQAETLNSLFHMTKEISENMALNRKNAKRAILRSQEASDAVSNGNQKMKNLLGVMEEISESSDEISKIVQIITDIAFQTNLLALNASVEAVRAGEAGKGFTVVADEVRQLAKKSDDAAKTIGLLILSTIDAIHRGKRSAKDTAESLEQIVACTQDTSLLISEISQEMKEEMERSEKFQQGLSVVNQVVQDNVVTAEESADASSQLAAQSQLLQEMVKTFQLK